MGDMKRRVIDLDPAGFNELQLCRSGPMVYNKNDMYVGESLRRYGEFSMAEYEVFAQLVRPGALVVEVGANIGAHTVDLSRLVGRDGEVHAIEPQRIVFQTLCANLAINQCVNVFARQAAVGARNGTIVAPAVDPSVRNNFGGLSLHDVSGGETVPLITLDSLDLPACHLLKADVEGMEVDVLSGGEQLIQMYRPIMYLENDREDRSEALLTQIQRLEYQAYWHFAPLFNPANFAGDTENVFSVTASVNVLCVPKEVKLEVAGLLPVRSSNETWRTVYLSAMELTQS